MVQVIKRDGRLEEYKFEKIAQSIKKASNGNLPISETLEMIRNIGKNIEEVQSSTITVEKIEEIIEAELINKGFKDIADSHKSYRMERNKIRENKSELMNVIDKIGIETDRDNANVGNNFSSKLLRIASESNKWHSLAKMPKHLARLHENGDLYYHDLDSLNLTTNCLHIPTKRLLLNGFNTGYGTLRRPSRIESAAELSCILLQSAQNDHFGGQSHPNFDNDLAPFVQASRDEIYKEYKELLPNESEESIQLKVEKKVRNQVHQAMQGVVYNLNTMHSRAGSQVPFSSVNIGIPIGTEQEKRDAALLCEAFLLEYEKGLGKGEQPIFPNIIFRVKEGINKNENDPYFNLFKLACRVASKRMNPTFMNIDATFNKKYFDKGIIPATMGCRTALMSNINGEPGVEGRGNIAPCTINLPRLGIFAKKDISKFFELLQERLEDARDSLLYRHKLLCKLKVKDIPFTCGQGLMKGSEDLQPDDSIEPVLKQGTYGIGFIGLAETLIALVGKHHGESSEARELGYKIIKYIRDFCDETTQNVHLNFSCYCTPAEGLSGKFIIKDKQKFGIIEGVTDKDYYTNSFHIPVKHKISISDKISIEAPYHELGNGGHISYIELDGYPTEETIRKIVTACYNNTNINYIGINFHIKYCRDCGTYLNDKDTVCKCGSDNIQGISRVTGYLSLDERFGPGKVAERKDRTSHNGDHDNNYTI